MAIGGRMWQVLAIALMVAALGATGCNTTPPEGGGSKSKAEPTGPHAALLKLFPAGQDVTDWKSSGDVKVFGPAANAAEGVEPVETDVSQDAALYRAYGYVKSGTKKYARGAAGETVAVRVFEMKSPSESFGVFSVRAIGTQFPQVGMALAARMSNTTLGLVKGPYFVLVEYAGTNDATPVLMEFGRWIAEQISSPGYQPSLLMKFPSDSVPGERYFLHKFETLEALPFVPKGDKATLARMLALSPETDVAIMGYPTDKPGELNYVFVIHYPSEGDASAAAEAYRKYLEASTHPAEQNVAVAPAVRSYVAGTFNAEENSIKDQLAKVVAELAG